MNSRLLQSEHQLNGDGLTDLCGILTLGLLVQAPQLVICDICMVNWMLNFIFNDHKLCAE